MNTTSILDLWSDDIQTTILTPASILRAQVAALEKKAHGILRAEVRRDVNQDQAEFSLDLIAPTLKDYQITLLKTWHDPELVYPAKVKSRGLLPASRPRGSLSEILRTHDFDQSDEASANSQQEYVSLVAQILQSGWVRSLIQSLIARSNEILEANSAANGSHDSPASTPYE